MASEPATTAASTDVAPSAPNLPAWSPTHVVAVPSMQAWASPDPSAPAVTLQAGVELQIVERLGDWAHVLAANGWTGWVDSRLLGTVSR
jgi:SH3-like domain-containing protein